MEVGRAVVEREVVAGVEGEDWEQEEVVAKDMGFGVVVAIMMDRNPEIVERWAYCLRLQFLMMIFGLVVAFE